MTWYANRERRRAFQVVRVIQKRDVVVLRNCYGAEFHEPRERLAQYGYRPVKTKPRYAT